MSRHASADLCFGVDLGADNPFVPRDEDGDPLDFDAEPPDELGEYLADRAGLQDVWDQVPSDINAGGWDNFKAWEAAHPEWEAAHDAYREQVAALEAAAPVEIMSYGYYCDGDPQYAIAVKGYRYDDNDDIGRGPIPAPTWDLRDACTAWCAANGLPAFEDQKWLLLASYG